MVCLIEWMYVLIDWLDGCLIDQKGGFLHTPHIWMILGATQGTHIHSNQRDPHMRSTQGTYTGDPLGPTLGSNLTWRNLFYIEYFYTTGSFVFEADPPNLEQILRIWSNLTLRGVTYPIMDTSILRKPPYLEPILRNWSWSSQSGADPPDLEQLNRRNLSYNGYLCTNDILCFLYL